MFKTTLFNPLKLNISSQMLQEDRLLLKLLVEKIFSFLLYISRIVDISLIC